MMRGASIIGVGMTNFGRHIDKTHSDLARLAVTEAFADAGVRASDLGMAIYANVIQGFFAGELSIPGEYALRPLGIQGIRVMNIEAACASSAIGLHVAVDYIRAGLIDVALIVGVEKLFSTDRAKRFAVFQQPLDAQVAQDYLDCTQHLLVPPPPGMDGPGPNIMMDAYGAQARLHMATYGTTARQIASVAAKNHTHSRHNPLSQYQTAMTVEEILSAASVAWPLTVPMCAPISDGAAAAIVCATDLTSRFPDCRPVHVLAALSQSGSDRAPDDYARHVTRLTAVRAYEAAGVGPKEIDLAEVHDASSSGEIIQVEALGLCGPGQGGYAAARGEFSIGGRVPVNPSGGLVSKGHPLGATGLAQIHELVTQLRGTAGARQVAGARIALAENSGGFYGVEDGLSAITLLARAN
jgi:acetyl-CoA acyltransferase